MGRILIDRRSESSPRSFLKQPCIMLGLAQCRRAVYTMYFDSVFVVSIIWSELLVDSGKILTTFQTGARRPD